MNIVNLISRRNGLTFLFYTNINCGIGDVRHLFLSDDNILFEYK